MAGYEVIADAGESFVAMLRDRMELGTDEVVLRSPHEIETSGTGTGSSIRLSLFLYGVSENEHLKNAERQQLGIDETHTLVESPLELDLSYLLTSYPSTNEPTRIRDQHVALGHAMQVLRDNPVIRGSDLKGSLAGGQELRITLNSKDSQPGEEVASVWNTFPEKPFQPSVPYLVGPVGVPSRRTAEVPRVVTKTEEYHVTSTEEDA